MPPVDAPPRKQYPRPPVGESSRTKNGDEAQPEMDPALWGELQRYIDVEKVAAQLPLHAFYSARRVCRSWDALPENHRFLEQHSTTSLPKPYFILHGKAGCHQALLLKDEEDWALRELPVFPFRDAHISVMRGVVQSSWNSQSVVHHTVFNLHTKVFHRLPALIIPVHSYSCSHLAVEKDSYKLLVAPSKNHPVSVYDSQTGVWATGAPSPVKFFDEDAGFVSGVMYMKWSGDVENARRAPSRILDGARRAQGPRSVPKIFRYSFKDDAWSAIPMTPPAVVMTEENCEAIRAGRSARGLGEWCGALRDVTYDEGEGDGVGEVRVWEYEELGQRWREVDRMPEVWLEWLFDALQTIYVHSSQLRIIKTCYCGEYVLISSNHFSGAYGLGRFVLYDMAKRMWTAPLALKGWICPCPSGV